MPAACFSSKYSMTPLDKALVCSSRSWWSRPKGIAMRMQKSFCSCNRIWSNAYRNRIQSLSVKVTLDQHDNTRKLKGFRKESQSSSHEPFYLTRQTLELSTSINIVIFSDLNIDCKNSYVSHGYKHLWSVGQKTVI